MVKFDIHTEGHVTFAKKGVLNTIFGFLKLKILLRLPNALEFV